MTLEWINDGEDVMARVISSAGLQVTILGAPFSVIEEDGPVVIQISTDEMIVVFSYEFIHRQMMSAINVSPSEIVEKGFAAGLSYFISLAMEAALEKFSQQN